MFDEDLKNTWKRAGAAAPALSRAEIEALLRPAAGKTGRAYALLAWTELAMLGLTALLAGANLYGYRGNATMLAVEGGLAAAALVIAALVWWFLGRLAEIGRVDRPLLSTVEMRLSFHERTERTALLVASVIPWMLSMSINTCIDNADGTYRINHPYEFLAVTAAMLGITYVSLRMATRQIGSELRALCHDLRAEALEATPGIAAEKRRKRGWMALLFVLLSLGVLLGFMKWLGAL